jgi:hypothetical protein
MEGGIRSDGLSSGVLSEDINMSETATQLDILRARVIIPFERIRHVHGVHDIIAAYFQ